MHVHSYRSAGRDMRQAQPSQLHAVPECGLHTKVRRATASAAAAAPQTARPTSKADLVEYITAGCKPRSQWRIGTEHEKLGFYTDTKRRIEYRTIRQLLEGLCQRHGWEPIMEGDYIIGAGLGGQTVTIEPGGQFELSGAPVDSLHTTHDELSSHLSQVNGIAEELGVKFLSIGFDPKWPVADVPIMPKNRYRHVRSRCSKNNALENAEQYSLIAFGTGSMSIMRDYMPTVGSLGHDMMFRSTTIQVNIDYEDERDMVEKVRIGLALQPLATALFSNSPFRDGQDTGYLSWRSHVWEDVDPARCGTLPFVWDDDFGFERYTEYALDVPMYFAYRDGIYLDATKQQTTFREFLDGKLPILPGQRPTLKDWEVHLTTIFPEIRLKRYIEMRGGDGGPQHMITALSAFWIGLLYSRESQTSAWELIKDWRLEEHNYLRTEVPKSGLQTPFRDGKLQDVAQEVLRLSKQGLEQRGRNEAGFLRPLQEIADSGKSQAALLRESFHGEWGGSVDPVYTGGYTF